MENQAVASQQAPQVEQSSQQESENEIVQISFGKRIMHNILALGIGGILAYGFSYFMAMGRLTADLMNQYGEVVTSFSGAEMVADITTGGKITIKTAKNYGLMNGMIITIAYDQEALTLDTKNISAGTGIQIDSVSSPDNMLIAMVHSEKEMQQDTAVITLSFTGRYDTQCGFQDARRVQEKTVFIAEADRGADGLEDLVMFTNTPSVAYRCTKDIGKGMRDS